MPHVVLACQALLVLVFAISVAGKVRDSAAFAEFVGATRRLLPASIGARPARWIAAGVVGAEVTAVVSLLLPVSTVLGFLLALVLLAGFTAAVLLALRRGERAPCRCFGTSTHPLGAAQVVRNAILLAAAALGGIGAVSSPAEVIEPGGVAIALLAAGLVALPVLLADDIADLFRATPQKPSPEKPTSQFSSFEKGA
ncbi:MAG TPA: MauE/DoxX family redox-associated membrane protein [Jiangellaceae bacterium]